MNFSPALWDTGNVIQGRAVFPERTGFHGIDESNRRKVQVLTTKKLHCWQLNDVTRKRSVSQGALRRHSCAGCHGRYQLSRAQNVRNEEVIVEAPDAVRTCGLQLVGQDDVAYELEVTAAQSANNTNLLDSSAQG